MKTILIIEDQPDMRRNVATILKMENYAVLVAENGLEGLAIARDEKPDLILCDVMMPELDGYGVLEGVRADPTIAGTPLVFLTAKGEKTDLRAGMNLGADDYLVKPVSASDLLATVSARLERERHRLATGFNPDFTTAAPLERKLGLTPREAEVLLWVAQGKSNPEIATILGAAEGTVKKHLQNIFEKTGVDNRNAASMLAFEILS
ncbi:MAG: response regulator transcription factor [Luteolibacter sp.]|uniref:response regulator transcription factor n=1 Tax=Luteolibacter sp. TaxID=1962973 RepID=UPI003263C42A